MDYVALIIALLGIFYMLFVLNFSLAVEISSFNDLEDFDLNEKVILKGFASGYSVAGDLEFIKINGVDVICECFLNFEGQEIIVEGYVDEYKDRRQVVVLRIYL